MEERCFVAEGPSERLDHWLRRTLPGLSRRLAHTLIAEGSVRLDGRRARKGSLVHPGMHVTVPGVLALAPNPALPLAVLHEDAWRIAVDKPGGMPSHPLDPRARDTVVNALLARYPETGPLAGGLVHRLDTGTSGVLVAARSAAVWTSLREAFRAHAVRKRYLALARGVAPERLHVDLPLCHDPADRRRMTPARPGRRSWPAKSTIERLATDGAVSLVRITMRTGVTHQIRVHLAHLGHPVLNDRLYGGPPAALPPGRHALHAAELVLPADGERPACIIRSPLPPELAALVPRAPG
ncbi:MAG TPA: RluA family pseudouridine synthase [Candidatus Limnocylindria bacterium]|nr:RluA family pseudouridine synthase [Candidatus Limnocylindria bacterium]